LVFGNYQGGTQMLKGSNFEQHGAPIFLKLV